MSENSKNVNNADISSEKINIETMPLEFMGLFFFAYRDFISDADELLHRQEFGRAHHRVLYFVNVKPGMSVADLLSILKITKQSLARVLRQLIDSNYIEQRHGRTDRRQRLLFPTKKGIEFFQILSSLQATRIKEALKGKPKETQKIIEQFFIDMVEKKDHPILQKLNLLKKS